MCSSFLLSGRALSPLLHPIIHLHILHCGCAAARDWVCRLLDLHTAAVHLDDLGSEGLNGSQYQLLVLQGSDAKAQYISMDTDQDLPRVVGSAWNVLDCMSLASDKFMLWISVLKSNYSNCAWVIAAEHWGSICYRCATVRLLFSQVL